jgi:hypothetical protein
MKKQQQEVAKVKNIGLELVEKDIDLVEGELVGTATVKHQGQLGWLSLKLEGGFSARPLLFKGIDWLEEKIPGDQTIIASMLKTTINNIKF